MFKMVQKQSRPKSNSKSLARLRDWTVLQKKKKFKTFVHWMCKVLTGPKENKNIEKPLFSDFYYSSILLPAVSLHDSRWPCDDLSDKMSKKCVEVCGANVCLKWKNTSAGPSKSRKKASGNLTFCRHLFVTWWSKAVYTSTPRQKRYMSTCPKKNPPLFWQPFCFPK